MVDSNKNLQGITRDSDILKDRDEFVCLDMNERVSPFSAEIFANIRSSITPQLFSAYPDLGPLYEKLSAHTSLPIENICIGAGSDGLIRRAFQSYLSPGDRVVVPEPTYGMYKIWGQIFGAEVLAIKYEPDLHLDIGKFISQITNATRLVTIASPDQPLGSKLSLENLERIAIATQENDALFIIDEAYYPLNVVVAQKLIEKYSNVLIIRTFSKYCGLAGLRIGFALASEKIISALQKVRSPGEVNSVGALVASYLLDHPEILDQHFTDLEEGRRFLIDKSIALGYEAPECFGNFQLLRVPKGILPITLQDILKNEGYLIKAGFAHGGLQDFIRITLDIPTTMELFCEKLSKSTDFLLSKS